MGGSDFQERCHEAIDVVADSAECAGDVRLRGGALWLPSRLVRSPRRGGRTGPGRGGPLTLEQLPRPVRPGNVRPTGRPHV